MAPSTRSTTRSPEPEAARPAAARPRSAGSDDSLDGLVSPDASGIEASSVPLEALRIASPAARHQTTTPTCYDISLEERETEDEAAEEDVGQRTEQEEERGEERDEEGEESDDDGGAAAFVGAVLSSIRDGDGGGPESPSREDVFRFVTEPSLSAQERLGRRISYIFHAGLVACPAERHALHESYHEAAAGTHGTLRETYRPAQQGKAQSSPAEKTPGFGLHTERSPLESLAGAVRSAFPRPDALLSLFSGRAPPGSHPALAPPAHVCLHREHVPEAALDRPYFDVDSSMAIFPSLTDLRKAVRYHPLAQPSRILSSTVHIQVPVADCGQVPLHKIPHAIFGTVEDNPVHIFFPRLYQAAEKEGRSPSVRLSDQQHALFFEHIMLPALEAAAGPAFLHHIPASYQSVRDKADARRAEAGGGHGIIVAIDLNQEILEAMWPMVRAALAAARRPADKQVRESLWQFGEPLFAFHRKNTKLQFRTRGSAEDCLRRFWTQQDDCVRRVSAPAGLRQQYLDLATEFVPRDQGGGQTVLARRCCQHNTAAFLYGEVEQALFDRSGAAAGEEEAGGGEGLWHPPRISGSTTAEYPLYLLRDAVSLTSEPRPSHEIHRLGLRYYQSYTVTKELFDGYRVFPFTNPGILHLGYDPTSWAALARTGHIPPDRTNAAAALGSSTRRVARVLTEKYGEAHGWRCEVRVSTALAACVAQAGEAWRALVGGGGRDVPPGSDAFFVIPSPTFTEFLVGNVHKHLQVLDSISLYYYGSARAAPFHAALLYAVVASALRHFISHMRPATAWMLDNPQDGRELGRRAGLGLRAAMDERGFGFFPEGTADWADFTLGAQVADRITIPELRIYKHAAAFHQHQSVAIFLDQLLRDVLPHATTPLAGFVLADLLVHLLLQDYRRVAVDKLFPRHCQGRLAEEWRAGQIALTADGLSGAAARVGASLSAVYGNRKGGVQAPRDFFVWTWGDEPSPFKRRHTANLSFRAHYAAVRAALLRCSLPHLPADGLRHLLCLRFFQQNTVLPYPDSNGTLSTTNKQQARSVLCVCLEEGPRPLRKYQFPPTLPLAKQVEELRLAGQAVPPPHYVTAVRDVRGAKIAIQKLRAQEGGEEKRGE